MSVSIDGKVREHEILTDQYSNKVMLPRKDSSRRCKLEEKTLGKHLNESGVNKMTIKNV